MIFGRFFRRFRGQPSSTLGPINEDWRAGDLAECVDGCWVPPMAVDIPVLGSIYRVTAVYIGHDVRDGSPIWSLRLEGMNARPYSGYIASAFRKVTPLHEAATAEFRAELRDRLKPKAPV